MYKNKTVYNKESNSIIEEKTYDNL